MRLGGKGLLSKRSGQRCFQSIMAHLYTAHSHTHMLIHCPNIVSTIVVHDSKVRPMQLCTLIYAASHFVYMMCSPDLQLFPPNSKLWLCALLHIPCCIYVYVLCYVLRASVLYFVLCLYVCVVCVHCVLCVLCVLRAICVCVAGADLRGVLCGACPPPPPPPPPVQPMPRPQASVRRTKNPQCTH